MNSETLLRHSSRGESNTRPAPGRISAVADSDSVLGEGVCVLWGAENENGGRAEAVRAVARDGGSAATTLGGRLSPAVAVGPMVVVRVRVAWGTATATTFIDYRSFRVAVEDQ
jgi:hypothetical protein